MSDTSLVPSFCEPADPSMRWARPLNLPEGPVPGQSRPPLCPASCHHWSSLADSSAPLLTYRSCAHPTPSGPEDRWRCCNCAAVSGPRKDKGVRLRAGPCSSGGPGNQRRSPGSIRTGLPGNRGILEKSGRSLGLLTSRPPTPAGSQSVPIHEGAFGLLSCSVHLLPASPVLGPLFWAQKSRSSAVTLSWPLGLTHLDYEGSLLRPRAAAAASGKGKGGTAEPVSPSSLIREMLPGPKHGLGRPRGCSRV